MFYEAVCEMCVLRAGLSQTVNGKRKMNPVLQEKPGGNRRKGDSTHLSDKLVIFPLYYSPLLLWEEYDTLWLVGLPGFRFPQDWRLNSRKRW